MKKHKVVFVEQDHSIHQTIERIQQKISDDEAAGWTLTCSNEYTSPGDLEQHNNDKPRHGVMLFFEHEEVITDLKEHESEMDRRRRLWLNQMRMDNRQF